MPKTIFALTAIALLTVSCASVRDTNIDYAHEYDFSDVKTFEYLDTTESNSENALMADRIESMIKKELREGGLTEVEEDGDIVVTYHVTTADRTQYNTTTVGYGGYGGWGPGWGYWGWGGPGMASSTTYETNYTDGTLIIDAFDPETKKLIWRGTGTVTVKDNPQKQVQQIEQILTAIGHKWDKILAGKGK
jgi:hypothetical protein